MNVKEHSDQTSTSKTVLLHPAYFGSIAMYSVMIQVAHSIFENEDNYQKQTSRNRTYIYGANGKLLLNIPVKHSKSARRQKYKEVRIENDFNWQKVHWKSLETAYRTSPYFEYYEDDFRPLYHRKYESLLEFNYSCMQVVLDCLQMDIPFKKTTVYQDTPAQGSDYRHLINAKKDVAITFQPYAQVFESKAGFLPNLSILDLLFNEGTNASSYLENQTLFL